MFEAGAAYSPGQGGGVAAGDFVFAEHLEELQVAEFPVAGLGEAGIEGVEHAGQFEGLEGQSEAGVVNGHDSAPSFDVVAVERDRGLIVVTVKR